MSERPTPSILLVDDEPANLLALEALLEPLGARLVRAGSGEEALRLLLREEFALVVLDVQMEGLDGFEVARLMRLRPRTRHVPIIFLTGHRREEQHALQGYAQGAVDYLVKPVDPDVFRAKASVFVELHRRGERLKEQEAALHALLECQLDEDRQRLVAAVEHSSELVGMATPQGQLTYLNAAGRRMVGLGSGEAVPRVRLLEFFMPEEQGRVTGDILPTVLRQGRWDGESCLRNLREGTPLPVLGSVFCVRDAASHRLLGLAAVARDISALKRTEERLRLLAEASRVLATSLEGEGALALLARLVVPTLADGCLVHLLGEGGQLRQVAAWPPDVGGRADLLSALPWAEVLERGAALRLEAHAQAEHGAGAALRTAGLSSVLLVPLVTRGRARGMLAVLALSPGRLADPVERETAEQLASRAALAVENARLYREAQAAVRVRDEFLSVAAHELRTPLTALKLSVQGLLHGTGRAALHPGAALEAKLRGIDRSASRLGALVDQLLDVSRLHAARLELACEPLELGAVAREAVERLAEEARRAGCEVRLHLRGRVRGRWDRLRLEQVLLNLLSNALKYGAGQPVEVEVGEEAGRARLVVRDRGIGIAPEALPRIFGRFERAVSERHYGGLGLGLFITRQVVEAFGGTVGVQSAPGRGAAFTVELPLAPASCPARDVQQSAQE